MNPRPEHCKCRGESLAHLVSIWRARTVPRVVDAVKSGGVSMDAIKAEAKLLRDLSQSKDTAFEGNNPQRGHLCDECPYRARTPLSRTLAVDRRKTSG